MASGILKNVEIKGIACAVPDNIVNNESYFEVFGEENVRKFMNMTGVRTRHVALDEQCASDLCYSAAKSLMEKLGWAPSSIDGLIMITQTPDYAIPSTACILQHRLGLSDDCIAFDINLGCSAYVYGLWQAAMMISSQNNINRVLLLVGDTSNFGINQNDSATAMIFGDGGSATALERTEGKELKYFLKTKGSGYKAIIVPAGHARSRGQARAASEYELSMSGADVFSFTITDVPRALTGFMSEYSIDKEDIDLFVFHQANLYILKYLAKKLGIPMEKMPVSIDRYGNTSGESIPLTLVDLLGGEQSDDTVRLLLCGFGVGLSYGGVYAEMKKSACIPMIYTNYYYNGDDGK